MSLRSREHDIGATSDPKMTHKRFQNDHKLRAKLTQGCKTYPGLRRRTGKPRAVSNNRETAKTHFVSPSLALLGRGCLHKLPNQDRHAVFINSQIKTGMSWEKEKARQGGGQLETSNPELIRLASKNKPDLCSRDGTKILSKRLQSAVPINPKGRVSPSLSVLGRGLSS